MSDAFTGRSADELTAAVRAANRAVFERGDGVEGLDGMGTTICAAGLTADGLLSVVHVGASPGSLPWTNRTYRRSAVIEWDARA